MRDIRFDFHGRHALITGASRGLGLAIAQAFAAANANLTLLADDPDIGSIADAIRHEFGIECAAITCDLADLAQVRRLASVRAVDILVNNAGIELVTPALGGGTEVEDTFTRIQMVNSIGSFAVTRAIVPTMGPGGRVIFTASVWGKSGEGGFAGYCASKHAVIGMVRCLAPELGPRGITVNAVCPGTVRTGAALKSLEWMAGRAGKSIDQVVGDITENQCLPGLMEPSDIVGMYLFLASEAAVNVTGQALNIDRGELRV